jgi:hypothetical protein
MFRSTVSSNAHADIGVCDDSVMIRAGATPHPHIGGADTHGADFWDQAADATQGATASLSISTLATSDVVHLNLNHVTLTPLAHDGSAASVASLHVLAGVHDVALAGAELHGELGSATSHDVLTSLFADQLHI